MCYFHGLELLRYAYMRTWRVSRVYREQVSFFLRAAFRACV